MTVTIYQSYYKQEQLPLLDIAFVPWNNTANADPDKREYPQMKAIHKKMTEEGAHPYNDYYGLVSWKFTQKTGITGGAFKSWIEKDIQGWIDAEDAVGVFPRPDVYFINPCFILEAMFQNVWLHGEWHHNGITQMANEGLRIMGVQTGSLLQSYMDRTCMTFCNYYVGNSVFWNRMFEFMDGFYAAVDSDPYLRNAVYSPAGYSGDAKITNFIFLFERLVPTLLMLEPKIKRCEWVYKFEQQKKVDHSTFDALMELSNLKKTIFKGIRTQNNQIVDQNHRKWVEIATNLNHNQPQLIYKE